MLSTQGSVSGLSPTPFIYMSIAALTPHCVNHSDNLRHVLIMSGLYILCKYGIVLNISNTCYF